MKSDLEAVHFEELLSLMDEFFGLEHRANRLGLPGRWGGSDVKRLGFQNDIDRSDFGKAFSFCTPLGDIGPARGWSSDNPVVAQRIDLESSASLSTLWALGTPTQRETITRAHIQATQETMKMLKLVSLFESESKYPLMGRGCLHATFTQGAAEDQTPQLKSTILIAQQYRLPNGNAVHFPLELQPGAVQRIFKGWESGWLAERFGNLGLTRGTHIPTDLFSPPSLATLTVDSRVKQPSFKDRRLAGQELFAAWFLQAEAKGFGPREVNKSFEAANRIGRVLRTWREPLSQDTALAVWDTLTRSGSRSDPPGPTQKDRGRDPGHSL